VSRPPGQRPRRPSRRPPVAPEVELAIDGLAAGGDGVGRDPDGRVTFVAGAAPGERVVARLIERKASFARGALVRVVAPSPDRVAPPCPRFVDRSCGGCAWQHVAPRAQAAAKQAIVAGALRRAIAAGTTLHPLEAPAPPYGWRRRARLQWIRPDAGRATIGFYGPGTRRIADVAACPQLAPGLERALAAVHAGLGTALGPRGELELLLGEDGAVHLAVHGPVDPAALDDLVGRGAVAGATYGGRTIGALDVALEHGVRGRADRFAQASREGNRALVACVLAAAGPLAGRRVLELHAGGGNLTRPLVAAGAAVVAVEQGPPPEAIAGVDWRTGDAAEVVAGLAGERFDLAVLDPPRSGDRALMAPLVALGPAAIVYVSCDPATLARDLEALVGYAATDAWPLDLMPQTAHVEVVVRLARR
jgi:23S rRNA (uracil1939-C5)-methyltransferase